MGNFLPTTSNVPLFWPKIQFSLFLFGIVVSIPCYLFVFYHILREKNTIKNLHNHVILMLLFYNFLTVTIDLPMTINYIRLNYVSPFIPALCLIWQYVDHGIWYGAVSLMFWASFERHILVFHSNLLSTFRRRLVFHYLPLIFFSLYTPCFFFYLIFIYSCGQTLAAVKIRCGTICLYVNVPYWLKSYDTYVNYTIPILLIAICSLTLLLRFIKQKRRMRQAVTWRHCRKMTLQLVLVSSAYIIFDLPSILISIIQASGYPTFASSIYSPFLTHLTFVPSIIVPFCVLIAMPNLKTKLSNLFFWQRNRRVILPRSTMN